MQPDTNELSRIFSNVMRDVHPSDGEQRGGPPVGFVQGLREILNLINPGNAALGDAVYSQEALDQIITNLMEANPQSNAAPPATEQALRDLDRRAVTSEMLTGESSTDCTICIEELKEGDMAAFLPCKHWFHADCVVLWLKEHNTCPICRSPIEKEAPSGNDSSEEAGASQNAHGAQSTTAGPAGPAGPAGSVGPSVPLFGQARTGTRAPAGRNPWASSFSDSFGGSRANERHPGAIPIPGARPSMRSRPPSQSQSRLNEAMRSISSIQQEERQRQGATTSGFAYDTSRMQRRNSMSPTSPPLTGPEVHGARMRQRSPSASSRRGSVDPRRRPPGGGPLSWLRDRFSGGGGSGQGSREDQPH